MGTFKKKTWFDNFDTFDSHREPGMYGFNEPIRAPRPKPPEISRGIAIPSSLMVPLMGARIVAPWLAKKIITPTVRAALGVAARLPFVKKVVPKITGRPPAVVAKQITKTEIGKTAVQMGGTVLAAKELAPLAIPLARSVYKAVAEFEDFGFETFERFAPLIPIAKQVVETITERGKPMAHPAAGTALDVRPRTMGMMPAAESIVRTWHANGIPFWRTVDGWIYVQRLDGTIKRYRPYKPVVLGKHPSTRQINRAINKLKSEYKVHRKLVSLFGPKRRS